MEIGIFKFFKGGGQEDEQCTTTCKQEGTFFGNFQSEEEPADNNGRKDGLLCLCGGIIKDDNRGTTVSCPKRKGKQGGNGEAPVV